MLTHTCVRRRCLTLPDGLLTQQHTDDIISTKHALAGAT